MENCSIRFWNRISRDYDISVYEKYRSTYDETIRLALNYLRPGDTALDLGCGTGLTTNAIAPAVKQVVAIDVSWEMIGLARRSALELDVTNVNYQVMEISHSGLAEGSFQAVMAFNVLQFVRDEASLLGRIRSLLAPGGLLLSVTDCYDERPTAKTRIMKTLSMMGGLPYMRSYTCNRLQSSFRDRAFSIIESRKLPGNPVNCFIAARNAS